MAAHLPHTLGLPFPVYWKVNFGESGGTYWAGWYFLDLMSWKVSFDSLSDRITVMLVIKYKSCTSHISGVPSLNFCSRVCAHPLLVNLGVPTEQVGTILIWWVNRSPLTVCQTGLLSCLSSNIRVVPLILVAYHPWTFEQDLCPPAFGESGGTYWAGWYVLDLMSWEVSFDSSYDRITAIPRVKFERWNSRISGVPSLNFCDWYIYIYTDWYIYRLTDWLRAEVQGLKIRAWRFRC